MSTVENKEILQRLLTITSSEDIADLIEHDDFFKSGNCKWIPYGRRENNAGPVEGQMWVPASLA